jgi:hypothetical protein
MTVFREPAIQILLCSSGRLQFTVAEFEELHFVFLKYEEQLATQKPLRFFALQETHANFKKLASTKLYYDEHTYFVVSLQTIKFYAE